jgi:hypothetical protein
MPDIDMPGIVAEVRATFDAYEHALVTNDVEALQQAFWDSSLAVRYGATENLHGRAEIDAFRAARSPRGLDRDLMRTVITTFGRDVATVNTLFRRVGSSATGRQSQVWVRMPDGWRITSAHVSMIPD